VLQWFIEKQKQIGRVFVIVEDVIFLDFQATTPIDPRVLEYMSSWMGGPYNAHAHNHQIGRRAEHAIEQARERVAHLVGAEPSEITFTSGATEASNIVLRGLVSEKDTIVISTVEHPSVSTTADELGKRGGQIYRVKVDDTGILDLEHLESVLNHDTKLVSLMAVNNEIGTIQPLETASLMCAEKQISIHSDLTQAIGKIPISLRDMDITYASMSSHKIYGPQGIGALYVKKDSTRPRALVTGGGQEKGLRSGTLPVAACVGFGYACELADKFRENDFNHATKLTHRFLRGLNGLSGWRVNGSLDSRIPHNLSISFEQVEAEVLLSTMPKLALSSGSACQSGSFKGSDTLTAIGLDDDLSNGAIRIGFGRTTTMNDIDVAVRTIGDRVTTLRTANS